jgi:four helix bundle protein
MGSASELEYQFLLAHDLGFLAPLEYKQLEIAVTEVKRMLAALVCKVDAERFAAKAANF